MNKIKAHGRFKELARRHLQIKFEGTKRLALLKIQNTMDVKKVLLLWFTSFLIEIPQVVVLIIKLNKINNWLKNYTNQLLKIWKRRVYSSLKGNTLGADLADMQLMGKFNKEIRLLLCVIDTFSKHSWVIPLKDKKVITIINTSQNIFISSKKKQKKTIQNMRKQRK